ncbi:hypothetical protein ACFSL6_17680 [Paenibacillus thailandensis]|uniref:Phage tail assembly protein n=1 Tax=Paenibacillus thailandensis TaxID=393250 RepID=A0ABW5QT38_9BACL
MTSANNNDVVILELDRPREVRYGHKALKQLMALTGKSLENIEANDINLEEIEKYLYCGLLSDAKSHGETLQLSQMEDLLDKAPRFMDIIESMQKALANAFGAEFTPVQLEGNGKTGE